MTALWHTTACILCVCHTLDHTHRVYYENKRPHKNSSHSSLRNPGAVGANWLGPPTVATINSVWFWDQRPTQRRYLPSNRNSWPAQRPHLHKQRFTSTNTVQRNTSKQRRLWVLSILANANEVTMKLLLVQRLFMSSFSNNSVASYATSYVEKVA